jgi:dimethylhistidine N-methyltransferase
MKSDLCDPVLLKEPETGQDHLDEEFIEGLRLKPKMLPCKFFYDARGSALFEKICALEDYYPTRTETRILRESMGEISRLCGPGCLLIELGSGSSSKTRLLLEHLPRLAAYVPVEISRPALDQAAAELSRDFPVEILPVCADYNQPIKLPHPSLIPERKMVFFPGSTIGNFAPEEAMNFLKRIAGWCSPGDGFLIGVDLQKDRTVLKRAYNDSRGVTAAFNLNLLHRANRELGANFNLRQFQHCAFYNEEQSRIEMHLVSTCRQTVSISGEPFLFERGEHIITEYSYKYRIDQFHRLARRAGWRAVKTWTDPRQWFSLHYLQTFFPPQ